MAEYSALAVLGAFVHTWEIKDRSAAEVIWRLDALITAAKELLADTGCPAHQPPSMRLMAELPVVDRLRSIASTMPCEHPVEGLEPGSPIAGAMHEAADLVQRLLGEREALMRKAMVAINVLDADLTEAKAYAEGGMSVSRQATGRLVAALVEVRKPYEHKGT